MLGGGSRPRDPSGRLRSLFHFEALLWDFIILLLPFPHLQSLLYRSTSALTRVAAPSPRASLGRRTVCGRTEQLSAAGFEALRNKLLRLE